MTRGSDGCGLGQHFTAANRPRYRYPAQSGTRSPRGSPAGRRGRPWLTLEHRTRMVTVAVGRSSSVSCCTPALNPASLLLTTKAMKDLDMTPSWIGYPATTQRLPGRKLLRSDTAAVGFGRAIEMNCCRGRRYVAPRPVRHRRGCGGPGAVPDGRQLHHRPDLHRRGRRNLGMTSGRRSSAATVLSLESQGGPRGSDRLGLQCDVAHSSRIARSVRAVRRPYFGM